MPEPIFLSKRMILSFHRVLLAEFGGTQGVRDETLLDSALETPRASYGGTYLHTSVHAQAAAYLFHLVQNHPFVDGNKRVAYAAMRVFLNINGYRLELTQQEKYRLVIAVAEGKMNKEDIASRLKEATTDT